MTRRADAQRRNTTPAPESPSAQRNGAVRSGVVLYVAVDDQQAAASGTTVIELAETLNEFARDLVPDAETHAAIALSGDADKARQLSAVRDCVDQAAPIRDAVVSDQPSSRRRQVEAREAG